MAKMHPISISAEGHGLNGTLVLPEGASKESPVTGAVILGGPDPTPLQRYSQEGTRNWNTLWAEALGAAGLAGLCYDQRGSGLSTGEYHEAAWAELYDDAKGVTEFLSLQPEIKRTVAIAWATGAGFALQLAAEGKVDGLVLLAPGYLTAEGRHIAQMTRLAASRGLSDRVVQLRVNQWRNEVQGLVQKVEQGERTATTNVAGEAVTTNLVRFLDCVNYDPAPLAAQVSVPTLILHGEADTIIPTVESEQLAGALLGPVERRLYPGEAHFLYRSTKAVADTAAWLRRLN